MLKIRNERRHRKAVELIREKLQITDNELNAFIQGNKIPGVEKSPVQTAKEVAELIAECTTIEGLNSYKGDSRQVVKAAFNKKLKEL